LTWITIKIAAPAAPTNDPQIDFDHHDEAVLDHHDGAINHAAQVVDIAAPIKSMYPT